VSQTIVVYTATGQTAYERDVSTLPMLLRSMAVLYIAVTSPEGIVFGRVCLFVRKIMENSFSYHYE